MAQAYRGTASRNTHTNRAGRGEMVRGGAYIYGNTVRKVDLDRPVEEPNRKLNNRVRRNREKLRHMSVGYVLFLAAALCVCALVLINYLQLQSEITDKVKTIARQESRLYDLQLANEENYNKIVSSVDLEEIKKVAIGELGMTYAQEGQIVTYSNTGYDYMRKVKE